jgi:hypothetical protein
LRDLFQEEVTISVWEEEVGEEEEEDSLSSVTRGERKFL